MIFEFLLDWGNYTTTKYGYISTARVSDGKKPFETFIRDSRYKDSGVVVESYNTEKEAIAGHKRWVKKINAKKPPPSIKDCCNSGIEDLVSRMGGHTLQMRLKKTIRKRKIK